MSNELHPYVVTFAGVPGSSKSIVAHALSEHFGLPIFSTDNIRFEVREDLLSPDMNDPRTLNTYNDRVARRRRAMFERQRPFILDGSMDRSCADIRAEATTAGYATFIIDMELSRPFMEQLYGSTKRPNSIRQLDHYLPQHETFMQHYAGDVNLRITDEQFSRRTELAVTALQTFIDDRQQVID